jgi:hypothetical protein
MYKPFRKHQGNMYMSDWADAWLEEGGGWDAKVYEVAGFDPIRFREISNECTLVEITRAWKTKIALSEYV